jgi:hypothetical protein
MPGLPKLMSSLNIPAFTNECLDVLHGFGQRLAGQSREVWSCRSMADILTNAPYAQRRAPRRCRLLPALAKKAKGRQILEALAGPTSSALRPLNVGEAW